MSNILDIGTFVNFTRGDGYYDIGSIANFGILGNTLYYDVYEYDNYGIYIIGMVRIPFYYVLRESGVAEQQVAEQQAAEQQAAEQQAAEQQAVEHQAAEQRAAEQRAAEQRAAEQRAAEQRAAEQRAAEQQQETPSWAMQLPFSFLQAEQQPVAQSVEAALAATPGERVPVYVIGEKRGETRLKGYQNTSNFLIQGDLEKKRIFSTQMSFKPTRVPEIFELFGHCEGVNENGTLSIVLERKQRLSIATDFVMLQTPLQIEYQQDLQAQKIHEQVGNLLPTIQLDEVQLEPSKLTFEQVHKSAIEKQQERLQLLRNSLFKCKSLMDFLDIQPEDTRAIKSHLDLVEAVAFIAEAHELDQTQPQELDEAMHKAYSTRIAYFKQIFVAPGAKHIGTTNEKNASSYLRDLEASSDANRARSRHVKQEYEAALAAHGIKEIAPGKYTFPPNYKRSEENYKEGLMHQLAQQQYKALEGLTLKKELETMMSASGSVRVSILVKNPDPESDNKWVSQVVDVPVTQEFIEALPYVAKAMVTAREVESVAYRSCLGYVLDPCQMKSHAREKQVTERVASIDFSDSLENIDSRIAQGLKDGALKKYLKYKNKYLNLKKQLNL